jgi:hypothetical protein
MKMSRSSALPAKILLGYLGLLLATIFALMPWPFYRPLIGLLYALLIVFFLFAFVVISSSFFLIFQTVRASLLPGDGGLTWKKPGRSVPCRGTGTAGRASDLWDEWVDGA